jgi:hypothetical protein
VQGSDRVLFSLPVVLLKGLRKTTKCLPIVVDKEPSAYNAAVKRGTAKFGLGITTLIRRLFHDGASAVGRLYRM